MQDTCWYRPVPRGLEIRIAEKMAFLRSLDEEAAKGS
jgi:putative ATPase